MTCRQMDNMISSRSGNSPLPPEAAEHVAGCQRCHTLVRLLDENREIPSLSHKQLKRIQAASSKTLVLCGPCRRPAFF